MGDTHPDLVTTCLTNRIADADERLENASSSCTVARAREQARFARMDLERRRPRLYGAHVDVTSGDKPIQGDPQTIIIEAARALLFVMEQSKTIEGEVIHNDAVQEQEGKAGIIEGISPQAIDNH